MGLMGIEVKARFLSHVYLLATWARKREEFFGDKKACFNLMGFIKLIQLFPPLNNV